MITLRPYETADAEALASVYRNAVRTVGREAYSAREVEAWASYPQDIEEFRGRMSRGRTIVAEAEGMILAFGQLDPVDHLALLYCKGEFSRMGVGSAIYEDLEAYARAQAVPSVTVDASRISRPFFAKKGYILTEVERRVWCGVEFERFRMEKLLNAGL